LILFSCCKSCKKIVIKTLDPEPEVDPDPLETRTDPQHRLLRAMEGFTRLQVRTILVDVSKKVKLFSCLKSAFILGLPATSYKCSKAALNMLTKE
jgi:hypothetical protein